MKPTLDEEIRDLARNVVERLTLKVASNGEIDLVAERIRAGIEAWKRQEPTEEMIDAGIYAYARAVDMMSAIT